MQKNRSYIGVLMGKIGHVSANFTLYYIHQRYIFDVSLFNIDEYFIQLFYTIKTYQHCKWVSRITNACEVWKRNASSFRKEFPILSVDSWREEVVIWEENSNPGRTWNEKIAETAILAVEISSTIISSWTERNLTESKKTGRFRQMIMSGIPYIWYCTVADF